MSASRRGAVYWATLAFGGFFLAGSMGGEIVYYKYFRDDRNEELKKEKDEDEKIQKFAKMELAEIAGHGQSEKSTDEEVKERVEAAKGRSVLFKSRDEYK